MSQKMRIALLWTAGVLLFLAPGVIFVLRHQSRLLVRLYIHTSWPRNGTPGLEPWIVGRLRGLGATAIPDLEACALDATDGELSDSGVRLLGETSQLNPDAAHKRSLLRLLQKAPDGDVRMYAACYLDDLWPKDPEVLDALLKSALEDPGALSSTVDLCVKEGLEKRLLESGSPRTQLKTLCMMARRKTGRVDEAGLWPLLDDATPLLAGTRGDALAWALMRTYCDAFGGTPARCIFPCPAGFPRTWLRPIQNAQGAGYPAPRVRKILKDWYAAQKDLPDAQRTTPEGLIEAVQADLQATGLLAPVAEP